MRLGIVVGETSGDNLGSALVAELLKIFPDLEVSGIAGPKLIALGAKSLFPMEDLAVTGLWEPIKRLPRLLKIKKCLFDHFRSCPPDVFIGIDSPDFNLRLEKSLRDVGIKTIHYVCPSVWAWRSKRIELIKKATDCVLTLFPFEAEYCINKGVQATFVGHTLADDIPLNIDVDTFRQELGIKSSKKIVAILPGSRMCELKNHAKLYIRAAKWCWQRRNDLQFIMPAVSDAHKDYLLKTWQVVAPNVPIKITVGNSRQVIASCDVALTASGTATLEIMLHKKPMVVSYVMNLLSYLLIRPLVNVKHISLPNLLANKAIVPEYIQMNATPDKLGFEVLQQLSKRNFTKSSQATFASLHSKLKCDANKKAAGIVANFLLAQSEVCMDNT